MATKITTAILRRAAAVRDAQGYGALTEFARAMGVSYQGLCRKLKANAQGHVLTRSEERR